MKKIIANGRTIRVSVFHSERAAFSWAASMREWVVMGDAGEFWTCRPVDAARLEKLGYELA
jgi:alkyl sulfatase BDS1-like metallo-beta-lactamase superfamily hydrolase